MCVRAFIDRDKNNYYILQYLPVRGPLSAVSVPTSSPLFCPAATTIASQQELGRKKPLTRVFLKREKKKIRQKMFFFRREGATDSSFTSDIFSPFFVTFFF